MNGFDIVKQTAMVRASIGLVIGGARTLYWKLTARDNLMYFASLYKLPQRKAKDRVEEILQTMNLVDRADERLEDYSSGMRHKVAIARALLHDPPVLLLDEPTLGLDPAFSRQIRNLIRDLCKKKGKTILLATHYMEEADELCDRVAIMNNGRIVATNHPDKLKAMVKESEVFEVTCYNPPLNVEGYLKPLLPDVETISLVQGKEAMGVPSRIKIIGGNPERLISAVIDALRSKNTRIVSVNIGLPTLEDVFIKLTGEKLGEAKSNQ